jgi:hypothetical protein
LLKQARLCLILRLVLMDAIRGFAGHDR